MATKLDTSSRKGRRAPDGKRVTFDRGQATADGNSLPIKTTEKE